MASFRYPAPLSFEVAQFSKTHGLPAAVQLNFTAVNPNYVGDHCHINAKDSAKSKGKRVFGWALWEFYGPPYSTPVIVGNFHSVWEDDEGKLFDVTPPKIGSKTLFVRDDSLSINRLKAAHDMPVDRTHDPANPFTHPVSGATVKKGARYQLPDSTAITDYCHKLGWANNDWS